MLYIANAVGLIIWFIYIQRRKKLTWHTIVNLYGLSVMLNDIPEVIFNHLLRWYRFPTHLLSDPRMANQIGVIFSDGIILPLGAVILTYYVQEKHPWRKALPFILLELALEIIYLKLDYLHYIHWSFWASAFCYLVGIGTYAHYAPRFVSYDPPIPYWIRITGVVYMINAWPSAILQRALLNLYQWRLGFFADMVADDRFIDLGLGLIMGLICGVFGLRFSQSVRPVFFVCLACFETMFSWYMNRRGILIYHHWNDILVAVRYLVQFGLIIWYERWETRFTLEQQLSV